MRFKTIYRGNVVEVGPRVNFREDNDGEGDIFDDAGNIVATVPIHGWNLEGPYGKEPLFFIPLPSLTVEQHFQLIKLFEGWYGDTDQDVSTWAVEFELIVRMLCYETCALVINPMYLEMNDDMYQTIIDIVYQGFCDIPEELDKSGCNKHCCANCRYVGRSGGGFFAECEFRGFQVNDEYEKCCDDYRPSLKHIAENLEILEDTMEATDNQGYSYDAKCKYEGKEFYVYLAFESEYTYEEQAAEQIYEDLYDELDNKIQSIEFTGPYISAGSPIGSHGQILISEDTATAWDLYPDWEKRMTMTDKPCLFYREGADGLKIFMPVGDMSQAPIEHYLSYKTVRRIYDEVNKLKPIAIYEYEHNDGDQIWSDYFCFYQNDNGTYRKVRRDGYYGKETETIVSEDDVLKEMESVHEKIQNWPKDVRGGFRFIKEFNK